MFKIGQKVTVVSEEKDWEHLTGQTGEIVKLNCYGDSRHLVELSDGDSYSIHEEYLKEEQPMTELKVGQKVRIKDGTIPKKYAGTTQEIERIDYSQYYMKGLPDSEDGLCNFWRKDELEPVEETMDYKSALKAAIDGHKVHPLTWHKDTYVYWDDNKRIFMVHFGAEDNCVVAKGVLGNDQWEFYKSVPKTPPKFSIGSTVVYRSNRIATVVEISESEPYEYTLNAVPSEPNCTFVKLENELKEAN